MSAAALVITDLVVRFGASVVLDRLSLSASPAAITAVLGPNGAGKTTLVRACTGLVPIGDGSIRVLGHSPGAREVAARVGVMPQSTGAWSAIRARELVEYLAGLYIDPLPVGDLCRVLGIDEFARTAYRRLSGGQQQSVNLAGALIGRPELVFLDEPTAGLDPHARQHTWALLRELRDAGVAVLLTTHAMDEAEQLADQVFMIDRGRVVISGTVPDLTREQSLEQVFLTHTTDRMGRP